MIFRTRCDNNGGAGIAAGEWLAYHSTFKTPKMETTLAGNYSSTEEEQRPQEGPVAKGIEKQTAKIPSDVFLWAALGSMATSATLKACGRTHSALFVGQWAAPFLLLGLYNKLVKVAGHDQESKNV
jgi:hypothetical protein